MNQDSERLNQLQAIIDDPTATPEAKRQAFRDFQALNSDLFQNGQAHDRGGDGVWWCDPPKPAECTYCGIAFQPDEGVYLTYPFYRWVHTGACENALWEAEAEADDQLRKAENAWSQVAW